MDVNTLPLEIQFEIFSNFSQSELCSLIAPICRHWSKIAKEPILRKTVDLMSWHHTKSSQLSPFLERCPYANTVIFRYTSDFGWLAPLPEFKMVTDLELICCHLNDIDAKQLLITFPNVRQLVIDLIKSVESVTFKQFLQWKRLTRLSFDFGNRDDIDLLPVITTRCEYCIELNLFSSDSIGDSSLIELLKLRGKQLKKLGLGTDKMTAKGFKAVKFCTNLTRLELDEICSLDDEALLVLKELPHLTTFKVGFCEGILTDRFAMLFHGTIFPQLSEVIIWATSATDVALHCLLKCTPLLEQLLLWSLENITDNALYTIADECRQVKSIYLRSSKNFTQDCVNGMLASLPQLQSLITSNCQKICSKHDDLQHKK